MSKGAERILKAAAAVILRDGITSMTLEATAAEAGMSKGGLLYHFPNKDKLIEALVLDSAEQCRESYRLTYENSPEGPGRMIRGLLAGLSQMHVWADDLRATYAAVFAALAHDPKLIEPMQEVHIHLRGLLSRDGLPEGVAEALASAIDGLWLNWVLGIAKADSEHVERVRVALEGMLAQVTREMHEGENN